MPWAASDITVTKKIIAACTNMRLPRFEMSKAILRFNRDNRLRYGQFDYVDFSYWHLAHLQRFETNVLHTTMRDAGSLPHAGTSGAQTQKFRSRCTEGRCRPGASPSMIAN